MIKRSIHVPPFPANSLHQKETMISATIDMALEEWQYWLEGTKHPFIVWMDHKNLAYIQTAKRLNSDKPGGHYFLEDLILLVLGTSSRMPSPVSSPLMLLQSQIPSCHPPASLPQLRLVFVRPSKTNLIQVTVHLTLCFFQTLSTLMSFSGGTQPDLPVTLE